MIVYEFYDVLYASGVSMAMDMCLLCRVVVFFPLLFVCVLHLGQHADPGLRQCTFRRVNMTSL